MEPGWPAEGAGSSGGEPNRTERRASLATVANPAPRHDYLVRWAGALADGTRLAVEFVPDRLVLAPGAFVAALAVLGRGRWPVLESLALTVLDDLNNELVPRWVRVSAVRRTEGAHHHATADDRQPDWDNPGLLARLDTVAPDA